MIIIIINKNLKTHLSVGEQGVHALEEGGVHDVGLVEDEADLLVLAAGAAEDDAEVLVKVLGRVLVVALDLEDGEAVEPGHEAGERRLARAGDADHEEVALQCEEEVV